MFEGVCVCVHVCVYVKEGRNEGRKEGRKEGMCVCVRAREREKSERETILIMHTSRPSFAFSSLTLYSFALSSYLI